MTPGRLGPTCLHEWPQSTDHPEAICTLSRGLIVLYDNPQAQRIHEERRHTADWFPGLDAVIPICEPPPPELRSCESQ